MIWIVLPCGRRRLRLEMQTQTQSLARSSDESALEAPPIARTSAFAPFDSRAPARPSAPASSQTNTPTPTADLAPSLSSAQIDSARGENAYAPSVSSSPASAPRSAQTSSDDSALAAADRSSVASQGRRAAVALSFLSICRETLSQRLLRVHQMSRSRRDRPGDLSKIDAFSRLQFWRSVVRALRASRRCGAVGFRSPSAGSWNRRAFLRNPSSRPRRSMRLLLLICAGVPSDDLGGVSVAQADKTSVVAPSARIEIGPSASAVSPYETPTTLTPFDPRDPVVETVRLRRALIRALLRPARKSPPTSAHALPRTAPSRLCRTHQRARRRSNRAPMAR